MYRKLLLLFMASLVTTAGLMAQGTIRGTVTDAESGEVLPGVNVIISQLNTGAASDVNGNYEITDVPAGTYTLTASFVGFQRYTAQVEVGNSTVTHDIELQVEVLGLGDAVVTAFGIQRERRALGYGVSGVDQESIENRNQPDVARALTGQMPGVDVSASGGVTGSGTDIVIRGMTTLTGSNAPLIVVDGVRFDGGRNNQGDWIDGGGTQSTPNRMVDLNPSNIQEVSVLKGLSATVLYGEEGRNGVILITTKSGSFEENAKPGFQISYDQSVYATQISSRPDYQDTYGGGFDQNFGWFFSNWGPKFTEDNPAIFGQYFMGFDEDGTVQITHPLLNHSGTAAAFPELVGVPYRYEAKQDPIEAFFRTGMASTSSLNIAGGTEDLSVNVNYSRSAEEGFTPNNELTRNAFALGAQYKINERFFANTTFNMSLTEMQTPPIAAGYGSGTYGTQSVFGDVFYTPRSIDLNMPYQNPITGGSAYYRSGNDIAHPKWTANNALSTNDANRYFGKTEFNYSVTDEINLIYRVGYDAYTENSSYQQNPGGVTPDDFLQGYYQTREIQRTSWDQSFNALFNYQLTDDFNLDGTVGAQYVTERTDRNGVESLNMIVFDFWRHSNFLNQSASNSLGGNFQSTTEQQTAGVFGTFTLGYQDFVYLNVAGRNDWFSTLEPAHRSVFYPSASLSYILSDHLDITNDVLTYVKLFAGVGTSAGSPNPYSTRSSLASTARGFVSPLDDGTVITTNATSNFLGNADLKPELHTEYEVGADLRFFEGKLGLEANAYTRSTTDLITSAPIDPATGYTTTLVNIGEIENQGLELTLRASPLGGRQPLGWDMQANFFASRSEVISLGGDLEQLAVAGFTSRGNYAIPGEPFMVMYGSKIERTEDGTPIVDGTGNYIEADDLGIIGDPNPDWTLSFSNSLRYKGASLSFQLDYQQGGDMFSTWISTLLARGLTTDTDKVNRNNTFVLPGVDENGDPNSMQISPSDVFFNNFGFGADELRVYDMTHIRLANVSLSYDLPMAIIERSPFSQVTLSLTGDNLWMFAFNVPKGSGFDPMVNSIGGNSRGFEYLTGPASRRFGGSLRVRF